MRISLEARGIVGVVFLSFDELVLMKYLTCNSNKCIILQVFNISEQICLITLNHKTCFSLFFFLIISVESK